MSTANGNALATRNGGVTVPSDPITLGNVLAASGFFSDSKQGAQAAVKVMAGQELGFGPIASMTGIYIVKGRVTLSANLMGAAIKRHPNYTFRVTEHTATNCVIEFIENGEVIGTSAFSMDDAKAAGLSGSETYRKFPKNMLYARALSNGAKWYCPDVFGGGPIYTPDELGEEIDGETGEVLNPQAPPTTAPAREELDGDRAAHIVASLKELVDEGAWDGKRVTAELVAAGAQDTSSVAAAVSSLTLDGASSIETVLFGALDELRAPADAEVVK